jgi:hypothetical protein
MRIVLDQMTKFSNGGLERGRFEKSFICMLLYNVLARIFYFFNSTRSKVNIDVNIRALYIWFSVDFSP